VTSSDQSHDREADRSSTTLLVAAGDEPLRAALKRFLTQEKYQVLTADTAAAALDMVRREPVGCVLLDLHLPGQAAADLVSQLIEHDASMAILVLSGPADTEAAARCVERGAQDALVKPMDLVDLLRAVQRVLRKRDAVLESTRLHRRLQEEVSLRTAELQSERAALQQLTVATLEALVNALEAKDPHLLGHSTRVAELAALVAAEYGLDPTGVDAVRAAGRLHDIGKIGIREAILNKHGPLTDEEFAHVKTHTTIGAQILAPLTHLGDVIALVRHHHERWDGKGYPDGLADHAIPIGARILGAVEIFDALTTSRPYQETMRPAMAVARMRDLIGTVLDPDVHAALERVIGRDASGG